MTEETAELLFCLHLKGSEHETKTDRLDHQHNNPIRTQRSFQHFILIQYDFHLAATIKQLFFFLRNKLEHQTKNEKNEKKIFSGP